jgi:hypothetical protein
VSKRVVDIDDDVLRAARVQLGTRTAKETINEALVRVAAIRPGSVPQALDVLAQGTPTDRSAAWR